MLAYIEQQFQRKLDEVGQDHVLEAAAAAWTAIRLSQGKARLISEAEIDEHGLRASIYV